MGGKEDEMELQKKKIQSEMLKTYKKSFWHQFQDFVGILCLAIIFLIILGVFLVLFITLVENPLSLSVICGTILLIWIWGNR